jgi:hypothetical protein
VELTYAENTSADAQGFMFMFMFSALQANTGTVLQLGHKHILPNPLKLIIRPSSYYRLYTV